MSGILAVMLVIVYKRLQEKALVCFGYLSLRDVIFHRLELRGSAKFYT
jgi:hypothetical protein